MIVVFAFVTFQAFIEQGIAALGSDVLAIYRFVVPLVLILIVVDLIRAGMAVRRAARDIERFEQPYRTMRAAERDRHSRALHEWQAAVRAQQVEATEVERRAAAWDAGPQWAPVAPVVEPIRVDVFGGDPRRHGWASLLVTLGTSVLAAGERITLLDLTGQDVGGGLGRVTAARGMSTRRCVLDAPGGPDLLGSVDRTMVAECLGHAITSRRDTADRREERVLAVDLLRRVVDSLDGRLTFGRLAAGVNVLRQGTADDQLSAEEVSRLVTAHIGDVDRSEWMARQTRLLANQLDVLADVAPEGARQYPLWGDAALSVIETAGPRTDRKELVDRLLVQLALRGMDTGRLRGFLVVAGCDHLGAGMLQSLSEHARQAGVRLFLMIDQPQDDLEKTVGTGGVVCIMKMYNHKDANVAADFIGKGHRFVVNQMSRQVGKSFTDGGSDAFAAATNEGTNTTSGRGGGGKGLSDSRGHTWTGTRTWSTADNISTSHATSRVYEFIVEPQEIFGMPETAFILVDNSGLSRRLVMADGNPGICLLDRVSRVPAG